MLGLKLVKGGTDHHKTGQNMNRGQISWAIMYHLCCVQSPVYVGFLDYVAHLSESAITLLPKHVNKTLKLHYGHQEGLDSWKNQQKSLNDICPWNTREL